MQINPQHRSGRRLTRPGRFGPSTGEPKLIKRKKLLITSGGLLKILFVKIQPK